MSILGEEPFFNLIDESWIPVLGIDGAPSVVSLRDSFRRAGDLKAITGDLPTQTVVILRTMLAVLHRAVGGPVNTSHWTAIRDDWDATVENVDAYLDDVHDQFWLHHPVQPFMQVPDLRTTNGNLSDLSRIICDGPGTTPFMSTRLGKHVEELSWADAARWLLHTQAFDVSGIHPGAEQDSRVKNAKGYGIGTGWTGQLGIVYVIGESLRDTLLTNLIAPLTVGINGGPDDLPVWERAPLTSLPEGWHAEEGPDQRYRWPTGPVDLYTWPSRRIRLFGNQDQVTAVINAQGDRAFPQNRMDLEPMTAWRYSEPQSKNLNQDTYMPLKHDPSRSFWRGLEALLPHISTPVKPGGPPRRLPPATITWLDRLATEGLRDQSLVTFAAVGIEYGTQESVYAEVIADELSVPAALLHDQELATVALEAVEVAEKSVFAVRNLAQNIALAAGGSPESEGPRDRASEAMYSALDQQFRSWVAGLSREVDVGAVRTHWQRTVLRIANMVANDLTDAAGPAALVGRTSGGQFRDAGLALVWFRKKLREVLPLAFVDQADTDSDLQSVQEEHDAVGI